MRLKKLQKLIITALLIAIVCLATIVVKIPSPATNGYFNLGDCFVLLSGWLMGPVYGALAAGLGSALADVLSGYVQYAPATFVIKAIMAIAACLVYRAIRKKSFVAKLVGGFTAEAVMVIGYFAYEAVILQYGLAAAGSVVSNIMQGIVGIAAGIITATAIENNKTLYSFFSKR